MIDEKKLAKATMSEEELDNVAGGGLTDIARNGMQLTVFERKVEL